MFTGNTNCRCTRKNPVQPFLARALRFLPTAWKDTPCMRVEVFGVYKGLFFHSIEIIPTERLTLT
jgi:hypothetical protein